MKTNCCDGAPCEIVEVKAVQRFNYLSSFAL